MQARIEATRRQRGTALIESLMAFLVLALGLWVVSRVQTHLRLHSEIARQRTEAVRLAQEDMETLRAFITIEASANAPSYADIATSSKTLDASSGYATQTTYTLSRSVTAAPVPHAKAVSIVMAWEDRAGEPQQVVLHSMIGGIDPAYSGALGIAPFRAASAP
ncbi:hypothetical protein BH11PSE8_BH11PSE8_21230 [soil metagenome]